MLNFRTEMFYRIKADGGILVNKKIKTEAVDFLFDATSKRWERERSSFTVHKSSKKL